MQDKYTPSHTTEEAVTHTGLTLDHVRETILDKTLFGDDIFEHERRRKLATKFTNRVIASALDPLCADPGTYDLNSYIARQGKGEIKTYMTSKKSKEALRTVGAFFSDLSAASRNIIVPDNEDELACLTAYILKARLNREPLNIYTPFCPDWSRDSSGRYDFKSLGGGESFIAQKFFKVAPEILSAFVKNDIPYKGVLIFADWGVETEIDAKDTYGRALSQEDVRMCFSSTQAETDRHLIELQQKNPDIFGSYQIVRMSEFFRESGVNIDRTQDELQAFFQNDKKGKRLHQVLSSTGEEINKERLNLNPEENKKISMQNLVEYATLGSVLTPPGIIVGCESKTCSVAYNLPKDARNKTPLFFLKGKGALDLGVNIL